MNKNVVILDRYELSIGRTIVKQILLQIIPHTINGNFSSLTKLIIVRSREGKFTRKTIEH